ncbi:MAG: hypothetical protein GC196_08265 [Hyphomonas sp.]|jgi:hypothetical protein|uniref:hypothetical protein n=1 Tax=Hyphomonas sp. TaxID=87 RepID=UPI0037C0E904|nr:hypothetical protein [Hyphomonas sp.]
MKQKAVAFFWTLPVPWAGFTRLPAAIDEAARVSRTIRFQRCLIQDYVRRHGLELFHEEAFLEINPDRGSETIRDALNKAAAICRKNAATLIFVDFAAVQGWRSHQPMMDWLKDAEVDSLPIEAVPVMMDGGMFDPHAHFGEWRERQWEWSAGKQDRRDKALARARSLKLSGMKYPAIAKTLNEEGVRSLSGRPWTPESLRKLMS